ncbi:hypothetical protein S245_056514 [Arachis hypogaea]
MTKFGYLAATFFINYCISKFKNSDLSPSFSLSAGTKAQHRHQNKRKNFDRNANRGTAVRDFSSVSENRGSITSQLLSKDGCHGLWPSPGKQSAIGLITVEQQR